MPEVKLYYFPSRGRAEGLRMLLAYGGQEFEDIRIPKEEWPEWKPKMKFGQVPVVEIDGKQLAQSVAAARFLAPQYGLAGADAAENYEIDAMVDFCNDVFMRAAMVMYEPDPEQKMKRHEQFSKEFYPAALSKINDVIQKNNGYVANGKLSWGDFLLAGLYENLKLMFQMPDLDDKYPGFRAIYDHVLEHPNVKAWVEKSPKTAM